MPDWIKIQTYRTSFEADLAQSVLASNGIDSRIMNTYAAQVLFGAVEFELWVSEADAENALNCLDAGETDDDQAL